MSEEEFIPGRKWEVPFAAFHPCDEAFYATHETNHRAWTHYLTAPNGMVIVLEPDQHFGMSQWVLGGAGGYLGFSRHGENLHLGTPGFCLARRFIEAMESLESAGIARPLPTKAVNMNGFTEEQEASFALAGPYGSVVVDEQDSAKCAASCHEATTQYTTVEPCPICALMICNKCQASHDAEHAIEASLASESTMKD